MTGAELRRIRINSGMGSAAFGRALGIKPMGADDTIAREVRRLQAERGAVPDAVARAARRFEATFGELRKAGNRWVRDGR